MNCKIFYSWQSDLPNPTNRGFIGQALENAAKAIRNDDSIQVEPVVDRDTAGVEAQTLGEVVQPPSISEQARKAVENVQPNQESLVRRFMVWLTDEFVTLASNNSFNKTIAQTERIVLDFACLAEVIATMNARDAARALYQGFQSLLERYDVPPNFVGRYPAFLTN